MKFIFADSHDYVDPNYDFDRDEKALGHQPYWDDAYPHELMDAPPYDGILVSRATVGDHAIRGKYTDAQAMRFRRVGARRFLRLEGPATRHLPIFGDCGAFSYADQEKPPYTPDDMIDFYEEAGFTHGFSVDHIIFEFDKDILRGLDGGTAEARRRFDLTLALAEDFLSRCRQAQVRFKPIGVVQGWSPGSMAEAAHRLVQMGYDYIALGGMVPLKTNQIQAALEAVRGAIDHNVKVHVLGFAKADELREFAGYKIDSFDTTSPLLRAFKDARRNYYLINKQGKMEYYTAIRIPQAHSNPSLKRWIARGRCSQRDLIELESIALRSVRQYASRDLELDTTLENLLRYLELLIASKDANEKTVEKKLKTAHEQYTRTLATRPWEQCDCAVCREIGVDAVLFRASNRNKRRGIHNLHVFHTYLHRILRP